MSRLTTFIMLTLAFVSCVAAVLVVPEVRCVVGLETSHHECGLRRRFTADVAPRFRTESAPGARDAVEEAVLRIRARFQQVENDVETGRLESFRKEISGIRGDSTYATIYLSGAEVPKVRVRVFENGNRTAYQAFYDDGGQLVFMFRTVDRLLPSGPQRQEEQRYYFDRGRMIRWLATPGGEVANGSAEYVDTERRMRALGASLLDGARSSGGVIDL